MCYFLYGAINSGFNENDYEKIMKNAEYHFTIGNAENVNTCVVNCGHEYRITYEYCDCGTPIGRKHVNKKGLKALEDLLIGLKTVRGIKYILLSKNWMNETNGKMEQVHINDIDILYFLANVENNCLYKIELYPKYY